MSPRRKRAPKPQHHARNDRRATLDVLLARAQRGVLSRAEAALLTEYVRNEQANADASRKSLTGTTRALARAREGADATIRNLESEVATIREGIRQCGGDPTNVQNLAAQLRMWRDRALAAEQALEPQAHEPIGYALTP